MTPRRILRYAPGIFWGFNLQHNFDESGSGKVFLPI
jgi:hypothetical protein